MGLTGLFFGSFNPIHNGHLAIARYLLDEGYCEKIWFVVSPRNPWKEEQDLLNEEKRLEIVKKAIAGDVRLCACDIEFKMPRPSYTYQTLRVLKKDYPRQDFALIIGGDNLQKFHFWKNYQEILAENRVFVYPRPQVILPAMEEKNVVLVDAPQTAVSSTEIRQKVCEGISIAEDVPQSVVELVEKWYKE